MVFSKKPLRRGRLDDIILWNDCMDGGMAVDAVYAWLSQLEFGPLVEFVAAAAAAVLCITVHETCHGLAALALGDPTAKRAGRLTLNPLKHVDPVGLVLLATVKVGWAKPVPIDVRYFKNRKLGMAATAIAGPLSNVALSALAASLYTVSMFCALYFEIPALEHAGTFFYLVFYISAGLAVFNLLPLPPLDGSKVLFALLPERLYWKLMRYERYGMIVLAVLLMTGMLDLPLDFLRDGLTGLLAPISQWTFEALIAIVS